MYYTLRGRNLFSTKMNQYGANKSAVKEAVSLEIGEEIGEIKETHNCCEQGQGSKVPVLELVT